MTETCPRIEALSARLDDALTDRERKDLDAHLRACPVCGEAFSAMRALQTAMHALPEPRLGVDLAGVIEGRIEGMPSSRARPRRSCSALFLPLLPAGLGLAASLGLGVVLGFGLTAGGGVATSSRIAAMAVFDPIAPGGVCIGFDACYRQGGAK
jgi:anti-sigma factor RsiW